MEKEAEGTTNLHGSIDDSVKKPIDITSFFFVAEKIFKNEPLKPEIEYAHYTEVIEAVLNAEEVSEGLDETQLLRQCLLHEIKLYVALMFREDMIATIESITLDSTSTESLINAYREFRKQYLEAVMKKAEKNRNEKEIAVPVYIRALNFYLLESYKQFGMDEATALRFVSQLVGLSEEQLVNLKMSGNLGVASEISTDGLASWIGKR